MSEGVRSTERKSRPLRLLSLFSGCGGLDMGFEGGFNVLSCQLNPQLHVEWGKGKRAGGWVKLPKNRFKVVFADDIRGDAKRAWTSFLGSDDRYQVASIVDLVKQYRIGCQDVFPQGIDVVTGGFPCQDFSVAGKRRGFSSTKSHAGGTLTMDEPSVESRGSLYMWMRDVISIVKPKLFVAENVKGLTNLGDVQAIIEHDFASIGGGGYFVFPARVLCAADYGVAQSRERVIFIGVRKTALRVGIQKKISDLVANPSYDPYPPPTHAKGGNGRLEPWVALRKVFRSLREPEGSRDPDQQNCSHAKYMGSHCQGQSEVKLEALGPTIRSEHHGNIEFRRLSLAHGGQYRRELEQGRRERRLTVRECARIQSFPDTCRFCDSRGGAGLSASSAYQLIGNAVPPLLGFHLAKRIEKIWSLYFRE